MNINIKNIKPMIVVLIFSFFGCKQLLASTTDDVIKERDLEKFTLTINDSIKGPTKNINGMEYQSLLHIVQDPPIEIKKQKK